MNVLWQATPGQHPAEYLRGSQSTTHSVSALLLVHLFAKPTHPVVQPEKACAASSADRFRIQSTDSLWREMRIEDRPCRLLFLMIQECRAQTRSRISLLSD